MSRGCFVTGDVLSGGYFVAGDVLSRGYSVTGDAHLEIRLVQSLKSGFANNKHFCLKQ